MNFYSIRQVPKSVPVKSELLADYSKFIAVLQIIETVSMRPILTFDESVSAVYALKVLSFMENERKQ